MGVPLNYPFIDGFSLNHPAIGEPPWLWKATYTSGGTKFMLLEGLTKHPSQSTADHISKPISCRRCGTVYYMYIYIYIIFVPLRPPFFHPTVAGFRFAMSASRCSLVRMAIRSSQPAASGATELSIRMSDDLTPEPWNHGECIGGSSP